MAWDESGWDKDHDGSEWIVAVELQESGFAPSCRSRVGCSFLGGVGRIGFMLSINEKQNTLTVEKLGLCANVLTDA